LDPLLAPKGPVADEGVPPVCTIHAKSAELEYIGEASQQGLHTLDPYPVVFGAQGEASKFSINGEEDVTAVGEHDVVADPAVPLHPEVSPTAQISRTSTL
jgi:hypothetical protein